MPAGQAFFEFIRKALTNLNHRAAFAANKMVVMAIVILAKQLKARSAIAKIKSFHQRNPFQQTQGAVNRGQIAIELAMDFLCRHRMLLFPYQIQNQLARARDAPVPLTQHSSQLGQILPWMRMSRHQWAWECIGNKAPSAAIPAPRAMAIPFCKLYW